MEGRADTLPFSIHLSPRILLYGPPSEQACLSGSGALFPSFFIFQLFYTLNNFFTLIRDSFYIHTSKPFLSIPSLFSSNPPNRFIKLEMAKRGGKNECIPSDTIQSFCKEKKRCEVKCLAVQKKMCGKIYFVSHFFWCNLSSESHFSFTMHANTLPDSNSKLQAIRDSQIELTGASNTCLTIASKHQKAIMSGLILCNPYLFCSH